MKPPMSRSRASMGVTGEGSDMAGTLPLRGLSLALGATLFSSAGNLYSQRLFSTGLTVAPSTAFEGYRWLAAPVAGMLLVLGGTVLVLRAKERASRDDAPSSANRPTR